MWTKLEKQEYDELNKTINLDRRSIRGMANQDMNKQSTAKKLADIRTMLRNPGEKIVKLCLNKRLSKEI